MYKFRKKKLLFISVILVLSILVVGCGTAKETAQEDKSWEKVKEKGELVTAMCAMYPPFESRNEDTGELEGFDIDLSAAIGEELGVKVVNIDAEYPSLIESVKQGKYDVIISGLTRRDEFKGNINTSDAYYTVDISVVVMKDNTDIKTIEDLKGKVVGVQSSGSATEIAAESIEGLKELKRYNYNPEIFSDLRAGRIDALVVAYTYAVNEYKSNGDVRVLDEPLTRKDIVMALKLGSDELTKKINEALAKVKESGKYDELVEKWLTIR